jgi:hypothetical protein
MNDTHVYAFAVQLFFFANLWIVSKQGKHVFCLQSQHH